MASLGAAVTADTAVFEVSAVETVAEYPKRYTIEDEVVYVTGGGGTMSLSVQRGADDTTAVAHAADTALTAAPVGSGGIQQVRLLGPFTVNFDDAGVDDDGVLVATLNVGDIILTAWVVTTTAWLANGTDIGHEAYLNRGPSTGDPTTSYLNFGALTTGPGFGSEGAADTIRHLIQHVTADARSLTVAVYPAAGSFTAGSLDCYALMATPA